MIIVRLMGGTGNQMFQYAAGRALAMRHGVGLRLDLAALEDRTPREHHVFRHYTLGMFNIEGRVATGHDWESARFTTVNEPHFHYDPGFAQYSDNSFLIGYWQSARYFESVADRVRREFTFHRSMEECSPLVEELTTCESVCLNIRRGDFVDNPKSRSFHGFYGMDYVEQAMEIIYSKIAHPKVFVFSDDVEWCRQNIRLKCPTCFVGHEWAGVDFDQYLYLMSQCRHFVIPNSSFAWWAVWINNRPEGRTVVAPKRWFQDPVIRLDDLIPSDWIRLDVAAAC